MLKIDNLPKKVRFSLRDKEIFPNTILSPMDGVTDAPFRRLCRVLSGDRMGLLVSEFVHEMTFWNEKSHSLNSRQMTE